LWDISGLFLKRQWRWPELWGMNLQQIRNPHLIFPGQILYLDKSNGRARLRVGQPIGDGGNSKLSPRVREGSLDDAITTVPVHLLEPFFNEAVIFNTSEELLRAPPHRRHPGRPRDALPRRDRLCARRNRWPPGLAPLPRAQAAARPDHP